MGGNIGTIGMLCRFISVDFLAVFFIVLGSKFGGNLLVEGGKLRFEGFQLVFLAPCAGGDSLKCRQIYTEFFYLFLIGSPHKINFPHKIWFDK